MAYDYFFSFLPIILVLVISYTTWILVQYWSECSKRRLPPGPRGLPFVGYIPFMTFKPHLKFQMLKKVYGPIFSLWMGSKLVIVISDYKLIKDAFLQPAFMGRPDDSPFEWNKESLVTGAINGKEFRHQRKFILRMFKELGFGSSKMEVNITSEIQKLLLRLKMDCDKDLFLMPYLTSSVLNQLTRILYGKVYDYDSSVGIMLRDILVKSHLAIPKAGGIAFFPWLKRLARFLNFGPQRDMDELLKLIKDFTVNQIREHEKNFNANNIRDCIDGYLSEIEKDKNNPGTASIFKKCVLEDVLQLFYGAGGSTTGVFLEWLLLILAAYPEVQRRIHREISEVTGCTRLPVYDDRMRMPYTTDVIMEVMRWRTLVPLGLMRYTLEDTRLSSYFIPRGTCVLVNLWDVHHDIETWGDDANEFKPERFLYSDGKERKYEKLIPYSTGKRSCPGEAVANTLIFLYITSIIQEFHITLPEGAKADFEGQFGIALYPKSQLLHLKQRNS